METLKAIETRRSIRKFTSQKISNEKIETILKAAMYAPSAMNYQPWHFLVLEKREDIDKISRINPHAEVMLAAQAAIIICGDSKAEINTDYLVQGCSAATQNALLTLHDLGLGGVWVSSYPNKDIIEGIQKYYGLPENIIPISIIAIGYPDEVKVSEERYHSDKIHKNRW